MAISYGAHITDRTGPFNYASGPPGKMRGRTWFGGSRVAPISFEGLFGLFLGQQFQKHLPFCWVRRFGKPLPKQLEVFFMNELFMGYPGSIPKL